VLGLLQNESCLWAVVIMNIALMATEYMFDTKSGLEEVY